MSRVRASKCERCGQQTGTGAIDPCVASLVDALNAGGIATDGSCCGHGYRPATILLVDGTWLFVAGRSVAERINSLFLLDINGDRIERKQVTP